MTLQNDQKMERRAVELRKFWMTLIPEVTPTHYRFEYWLRRLHEGECIAAIKTVAKRVTECPGMNDNQILGFTEALFDKKLKVQLPQRTAEVQRDQKTAEVQVPQMTQEAR